MKKIVGFTILIVLISCQTKEEQKNMTNESSFSKTDIPTYKIYNLFILNEKSSENFVKVIPPKNSDFEFPDNSAKTKPYKKGDFNADGKEDILVSLGACGSGGCMYGLFLNQYDQFYELVFMGYLKNVEFKVGENGIWTILSSEAIDPFDPSKTRISSFEFDKSKYEYKLDTTYVSYN